MRRPGLLRSVPGRQGPPPAAALRGFRFPPFETHRLDNGLALYLAPVGDVPLIAAELLLSAGAQHDPSPGIARLSAEMLDEGTASHSAIQLAEWIEDLGGALHTGAGWNLASVGVDLLSSHLDQGLELIARCALEPSFPADEVERLRDETLAELLRRRDVPSALASDAFADAVYGGSVYAHPVLGTEAAVRAATRDQLMAFYRRHAVPAGAALLVAGSFDPARVRERVEVLFGGWQGGPETPDPLLEPRPLAEVEVHLVDRPGSSQSVLQIGCAGPLRSVPDYTALQVANLLFGGKFSSRINLNLRERHGYTYGANSTLQARRGPGPFFVRTNVATEHVGAAAREIFSELERLRTERPEEEELRDTVDYLLGVFPTTLQKVSSLASRLESLVVHRLDDDFYDGYTERLQAVGAEDVRTVAARYLDPTRMVVVAVGPAAALEPQLAALGPLRLVRDDVG